MPKTIKKTQKHRKNIQAARTTSTSPYLFWICLLCILIGLVIVLRPLMEPGFFITDDGEWMIIRLSAFYQSLSTGQFPVRFLGRLNHSYGYPVANFLYPGFLYLGSVLRLIGFSFIDVIKIILGGSVFVGAFSLFAALRKKYRLLPATIATLQFLTTPYLLYDIYHRGSVGEVLAIGVSMVSVYAIVAGWAWALGPLVALLITSHNTLALMMLVALVVFVLSMKRKKAYLLSIVSGIVMAAFFWIPALLEKRFVRFDMVVVSDALSYMINTQSMWLLGGATLAACLVYIGMNHRAMLHEERVPFWLTIVGLFMALPLSSPLWGGMLSQLVQFPYRFLSLTVVFGPWVVAAVMERLKNWHIAAMMLVLGALWQFTLVGQLSAISHVDRPITYYTTNEATTTVADEYMPRWVKSIPSVRSVETIEVVDGDIEISERTFLGEKIAATIHARQDSIIAINKVYYPGWGVALDQVSVPIDFQNETGVMRITIPQGEYHLVAQFRETPTRFIADLISVAGGILFLVYVKRIQSYV